MYCINRLTQSLLEIKYYYFHVDTARCILKKICTTKFAHKSPYKTINLYFIL